MTNSMIETLKARRKVDKRELEDLSTRMAAAPGSAARILTEKFDAGMVELRNLDDRIEELQEQDAREGRAAAHRVEMNAPGGGSGRARYTTNEDSPYQDPHEIGADAPSFFRDVRSSRMGDYQAAERLQRLSLIHISEPTRLGM